MNVSRESILALQRHFLGALSAPSRTWLEPLPAQPLVFAGAAIRAGRDGCAVDFGSVSSPGEERCVIRVGNRETGPVDVRLDDPPAWLMASWAGVDEDSVTLGSGETAALELIVIHDAEREFAGALRFLVADRVEELGVRLIARRTHPVADIDFNGSPAPHAFDFGTGEGPYVLTIANRASIPLVVAFADLPDWLTFHVDGRSRGGPIAGSFFERAAPFTVHLRPQPQHLGAQWGALRVRTNDPRPEMRNIELHFAASVVSSRPCLRAVPPPRARMRADQTMTATARLENWGRIAARTSKEIVPAALSIRECPIVPAADGGQPGVATLPIRLAPKTLVPGAHTLTLSLRVDGGDPATVDLPVEVDVDPRRRPVLRPELVAALFALLFLTLLFVIARGMP